MNLIKLFETQSKLDARIVEEKGLHGRDLLPEKMLALLTELGELSNEWQGFKFWKEDREPRTKMSIRSNCKKCEGVGYFEEPNGVTENECMHCGGDGQFIDGYRNPLLEEYVDNLHFILSIGLELHPKIGHMGWTKNLELNKKSMSTLYGGSETTVIFIALFKRALVFADTQELKDYGRLFALFLTLGEKLDFTLDQIETAYYSKNEINHSRQNNGY